MIRSRHLYALVLLIALPGSAFSQSYLESTASIALDFYQRVLSPIRQPAAACQFEPSCSQFARNAVSRYGPFVGTILAADRLMRCGHSAHIGDYPLHNTRFDDPANRNYLFGEGSLWHLPLGAPEAHIPFESVDSSFRLAFVLAEAKEYEYSNLELTRVELTSTVPQDRLYAHALFALNELGLHRPKSALAHVEAVVDERTSAARSWHTFLISYLSADAEDLDAWNAGRSLQRLDDSNSRYDTQKTATLQYLALYSRVKGGDYEKARTLTESVDILSSIKRVEDAGGRSPLLAGVLGTVLPGSGYLYAGRYGEAFSAFSFNALLGWGIYSLFTNHNTGSAILLSSIALPFYLGNIAGGYNAVAADNDKARLAKLVELQSTLKISFYFSPTFVTECWQQ